MTQPSVNRPCPCGSGKKYKRCCGAAKQSPKAESTTTLHQLVNAALSALQRHEIPAARRLIDQALSHKPGDSSLIGIKGMVAYEDGQFEEAEHLTQRAIALNPGDSRLYNFMGQIHLALKLPIEAERAFGQAVTLDQEFIEAWFNLGITQLQRHEAAEAIRSFQRVLQYTPNDADLHLRIAQAHYLQGATGQATEALRLAGRLGGDPAQVQFWLSTVLRAQGSIEHADQLESRAWEQFGMSPQCYTITLALGMVETHLGHLDVAEHWLRRAIALQPNEAKPYVELASVRKFLGGDRALVEQMVTLLVTCPVEQRRGLEFALGKIYTDIGDYDASFAHYQAGNDLVRHAVPFDKTAFMEEVSREIAESTQLIQQHAPMGSDSRLPILIVGTPRSGTTLTEQIISSHSQVGGAGEMDFWSRLAPLLLSAYTEERAKQVAQGYLDVLRQHVPNAPHVTDKMPGNFIHLGIIHAALPNAKIIHCKRHPIDACLSIYFQNFNDGHAYKWDLESLAFWYEQYQHLMAHWRTVLPPESLFEFRYEDLVEDVEGVSRPMMEFLGLEWESGQLDFHKQDRAVFTASKWQARQPIYKTSKERWRRYEKHLGPLLGLLKYA